MPKKHIKGTEWIEPKLKTLCSNFPEKLEYIPLINLSWRDCLKTLSSCDILIDQVLIGWYGGISVEAALLGVLPIAYVDSDLLCFVPEKMRNNLPVLALKNREELPHVLKELIRNRERISQETLRCHQSALEFHHAKAVARQIIEKYYQDLPIEELKARVCSYWNKQPCGAQVTNKLRYSKAYFDEIENYRYSIEPEILPFAQFEQFGGKKMLEVGIGTGTDFIQWVRAGAKAYGVDLSPEAIEHAKKRLAIYGLKAEEIRVADCETLPYEDASFDLVYSWGVIHHTSNTQRALEEVIRVTRPGGSCKVMVYNKHSLVAFYLWVKMALLKGKPWRSFSWCVYHFMESIGTKAFTVKEVTAMLSHLPVEDISIQPILTHYDRLGSNNRLFRFIGSALSIFLGNNRVGWFITVQFSKKSC